MKMRNLFLNLGIVLLLILGFASCNEDFSNLDTDIIGANFNTPDTTFSVKAYSKLVGGIQSNDQQTYKLGVYSDPVYGTTVVDFLAQVEMSNNNPTFPHDTLDMVLEKVILTMPFFYDTDEDDEGETVYTLDSIYGNLPINVAIYESNYQLRDFDPSTNFEEAQKYYTNQGDLFQSNLGELITSVEGFYPSNIADEYIIEDLDTLSIEPGFNIELPVEFFQEKIIDMEGDEVLLNNNNFKEYFRGLYFKVDDGGTDGNMFMFQPEDAKITLYYSSETTSLDDDGNQNTNDDGDIIRVLDSYELSFTGINVNTYSSMNFPSGIMSQITNPNVDQGEEKLYVQGGQGIATIIDLFTGDDNNNGIDDLEELRERKWLINEANLIFYVDQSTVSGGSKEPERIMIFDTKNNSILADYSLDLTSNLVPVNAITEHLGRLERNSDDQGIYYKIRITSHVSNLINRDSSNVSLGLVVSQNVSYVRFFDVENALLGEEFEQIPGADIISPEGTVLHGNRSPNTEKRLKLELFYTEPD